MTTDAPPCPKCGKPVEGCPPPIEGVQFWHRECMPKTKLDDSEEKP